MKPSSLIIDTELICYKWTSSDGSFPDYEKLIPTEASTVAHLDTIEAVKAIASLKVLADSKSYPIDITIGDGKIVMANPDDKGQAELTADTDGKVKVRLDGSYLAQALKACGGMVDFKLTNSYSPTLFTTDGYQLVVMPMLTNEANEQAKADREAKQAEPKAEAETVTEAEAIAKAKANEVSEPVTEAKPKRSRKRDKVAVA